MSLHGFLWAYGKIRSDESTPVGKRIYKRGWARVYGLRTPSSLPSCLAPRRAFLLFPPSLQSESCNNRTRILYINEMDTLFIIIIIFCFYIGTRQSVLHAILLNIMLSTFKINDCDVFTLGIL